MQGQKASRVDQLKKQVDNMGKAIEHLYMELTYQRQINETLANVCKQLDEWDDAVAKLKAQNEEAQTKTEEDDNNSGGLELGPKNADSSTEQEEVSSQEETSK